MPIISSLHARQILDSRGTPTIEVDCVLDDGSFGRAAVPSGASTGSHEAVELRDEGKEFGGKSVMKAVGNVDGAIAKALVGNPAQDQRALDTILIELDGTENKSTLGANAILGASLAIARARAASEKQSLWMSLRSQFALKEKSVLPVPLMNVINGGKHADSGLSFQECMIVPVEFDSFSSALRAGTETFMALKKLLHDAGHITAVGDEGGFAPRVKDANEAFTFLMNAIEKAGYTGKIKIGIDCAASEFYAEGKYTVDGQSLDSAGLVDYYESLTRKYPIITIEDSHSEDDWDGFTLMNERMGKTVQLVGDDLFVTNVKRVQQGIEKKAANSVLIKLNQIGTLSETVDTIMMCKDADWTAVVSHRSGETEDTFIADLCVALATGQIKTGSLSRTDRVCKYNQLLRIEEELGQGAVFAKPF